MRRFFIGGLRKFRNGYLRRHAMAPDEFCCKVLLSNGNSIRALENGTGANRNWSGK
jgi:hypothetical protein